MENKPEEQQLIKEVSSPIFQSRGWMKFIGIISIIYGALLALSIVGIIIAWLPIWLGILIFQSASSAEKAFVMGDKHEMIRSMDQLKTYFTISGVLALIAIVLSVIGLTLGVFGALFSFAHYF